MQIFILWSVTPGRTFVASTADSQAAEGQMRLPGVGCFAFSRGQGTRSCIETGFPTQY
jgi:hypothetical protein